MVESSEPSPTSTARQRESLELCRKVLSEREWEAWKRIELEGCTAVEAAEIMDATDSAVRSLLHRAREKLILALGTGNCESAE